MTFRFMGLVPAIALLAVGGAHAQSTTGGGGGMAYPDPLPSGRVTVQAPSGRDTGSMALPNSTNGIREQTPGGRDTGNMAYPATSGAITTRVGRQPAAPATGAMTPAAKAMEATPSSAPIPYTDFLAPEPARGGRSAAMHRAAKPHAVKKAVAKPAAPAATPATAAPATPATPAAKPATPAPTK